MTGERLIHDSVFWGANAMPDSWDAGEYRNRATAWLQKAESLPEGPEREACFVLAEGYVRLAELIEAQQSASVIGGSARSSS
jgi:hypothetical protein